MSDAATDLMPTSAQGSVESIDPDGTQDPRVVATQEAFIAETLDWCAELFGMSRARFVRPLESGGWRVYTRQKGTLSIHIADHAEAAMAYTVGLGRQPLIVTRPRVAHADGSGLRPIALNNYIGIPLVCQDRLVGVIELAGTAPADVDTVLYSALPRLARAGARLLFDPSLHHRSTITLDSLCTLSSAVWASGDITLTPAEIEFLAAITGVVTVAQAGATAGTDERTAIELTTRLCERGLIEISHSED